ncbi:MAG TPA: heparinase II/III family protein [Capsulimonadaceae bacterium]|jgi:hypothetical protein
MAQATIHHPYVLSSDTTGPVLEDFWPTIFYGIEVADEVRRKVSTVPWASDAFRHLVDEADSIIALPPHVPHSQAGWRHEFFSRSTGAALVYDPWSPTRFLDPTTGLFEFDEAQGRAWVLLTHERTYRLMRSVGVLYAVTGDERYAEWVADGMRVAAEYFTHTEFCRDDVGGPALYYHSLYDAAMLMALANAFSLTRTSAAYRDGDEAMIRAQIFESRMPTMVEFLRKRPTHNMSCFVSGALAVAGELFNVPEWGELALGPNSGLRVQLEHGLPTDPDGGTDGLWYEGTMFYHYYSLSALISLWEVERRRGGPLAADPELNRRFDAMFDAPMALVDSQLRLPLVGDLGAPRTMRLAGYRHLYEYAAGRNPDRFGPALAAIYERSGEQRVSLDALAFGPDELPEPGGIPATHSLLPVAQFGVFRSRGPEQLYVTFRGGDYVGGHDHPDRLTVALSAFGHPISPDLGEAGYSLRGPGNLSYQRTTLSHNTLFADEREQIGNATLEWLPDAVPARARGVIVDEHGVRFTRTVYFDAPFVVLVDDFDSADEHRYGWMYHAYGGVTLLGAELSPSAMPAFGLPELPDRAGYAHLVNRRRGIATASLTATWQPAEGVTLNAQIASDGPLEVTVADTPGNPYPDSLGAILLRAPGRTRRIATVLEPFQGQASATAIELTDGGATVTVTGGDQRVYRWDE